jgi:hypothetical protein
VKLSDAAVRTHYADSARGRVGPYRLVTGLDREPYMHPVRPYAAIVHEVVDDLRVTDGQVRLLLQLIRHARGKGWTDVKDDVLARGLGRKRESISRHLGALESMGYVVRKGGTKSRVIEIPETVTPDFGRREVAPAPEATCDISRATCDISRATCDISPSTCDILRPICDISPPICDIPEAEGGGPFVTELSQVTGAAGGDTSFSSLEENKKQTPRVRTRGDDRTEEPFAVEAEAHRPVEAIPPGDARERAYRMVQMLFPDQGDSFVPDMNATAANLASKGRPAWEWIADAIECASDAFSGAKKVDRAGVKFTYVKAILRRFEADGESREEKSARLAREKSAAEALAAVPARPAPRPGELPAEVLAGAARLREMRARAAGGRR